MLAAATTALSDGEFIVGALALVAAAIAAAMMDNNNGPDRFA